MRPKIASTRTPQSSKSSLSNRVVTRGGSAILVDVHECQQRLIPGCGGERKIGELGGFGVAFVDHE